MCLQYCSWFPPLLYTIVIKPIMILYSYCFVHGLGQNDTWVGCTIMSSIDPLANPCSLIIFSHKLIRHVFLNFCIYVNFRFLSVNEQPIAAASISQVHRAVLRSGRQVAIKVCTWPSFLNIWWFWECLPSCPCFWGYMFTSFVQ